MFHVKQSLWSVDFKAFFMIVVIKERITKKETDALLQSFKKKNIKKSLRSVYGIYKVEGDAVELQKKMRDEWDWFFSRH